VKQAVIDWICLLVPAVIAGIVIGVLA